MKKILIAGFVIPGIILIMSGCQNSSSSSQTGTVVVNNNCTNFACPIVVQLDTQGTSTVANGKTVTISGVSAGSHTLAVTTVNCSFSNTGSSIVSCAFNVPANTNVQVNITQASTIQATVACP